MTRPRMAAFCLLLFAAAPCWAAPGPATEPAPPRAERPEAPPPPLCADAKPCNQTKPFRFKGLHTF